MAAVRGAAATGTSDAIDVFFTLFWGSSRMDNDDAAL